MEEIKVRLEEMWDDEVFALKWLEANSVYQVLDPNFIKESMAHK